MTRTATRPSLLVLLAVALALGGSATWAATAGARGLATGLAAVPGSNAGRGTLPAAEAAPQAAAPRIIGGSVLSSTTQAPSTVLLQIDLGQNGATCSGTIADARHVITAAHCVVDGGTTVGPAAVRVGAGIADATRQELIDAGQVRSVSAVRVHPRYRANRTPDDVAVLTLAQPLDLSTPAVRAMALRPARSAVRPGTRLTVSGFGITSERNDDSGILRQVRSSTVVSGLCGTNAPAAFVCTYRPNHGACEGDSGGTGAVGSTPVLAGVLNSGITSCATGLNLFADLAAPEVRSFVDLALQDRDVTASQTPRSPRGGRSVAVSGTPRAGRVLTCRRGSWSKGVRFRYSFFRLKGNSERDTALRSAKTYRVRASDRGRQIGCAVEARNAGGTGVAVSSRLLRAR